MTVALLVLAVLVNFAPEHLTSIFGGRQSAWEYATNGAEAAALWAVAMVNAPKFVKTGLLAAQAACAWGMFEALQRPVCRLAFPMDKAPRLEQGQNLCDAAYGLPMSWFSVLAALAVAALLQEMQRARR